MKNKPPNQTLSTEAGELHPFARIVLAGVVATAVVGGVSGAAYSARGHASGSTTCAAPRVTIAYAASVGAAVRAGKDVWGERLLAAPGGPSYEAARRYLAPLLFAMQPKRRPLTPSGVYYLGFSYPTNVKASSGFALHVADGSRIYTRRVGGPNLAIYVGAHGTEPYGACLNRLKDARLADGYLPIVRTSYVDANGVRYGQESFAARGARTRKLVSFVKLTVNARRAGAASVVRFVSSRRGTVVRGVRLEAQNGTRLIVSPESAGSSHGFTFRIPKGTTSVLYADWLNQETNAPYMRADSRTYAIARDIVSRYWNRRLAEGAVFGVPEKRVMDAERAVLIQQLVHGWHYSIGNPYEELSFAETMDTAEVMGEYGFDEVVKRTLRTSGGRLLRRFTSRRGGERLLADAVYYQLSRDPEFIDEQTPVLRTVLAMLERRQITAGPSRGKLQPEPLSSDVPDVVDTVPGQLVAWQGLLAIERVWAATGHGDLAPRARTLAVTLERPLRSSLRESLVPLDDGSLFLPFSFAPGATPYELLTASRDGSYWNLVAPYALASGFLRPRGAEAAGVLRYLLDHGSRLLGVPRADAHIIYGPYGIGDSGLGQVYGLSASRFLADEDEPDQLMLSLYGMLAASMTRDTFIAGEATSVVPVGDSYYRTSYMPPNLGANSTFLETLRLMLVHETRGSRGAARGLELAFATPRSWLRDGRTIHVANAPTSFGRLSYSIARRGREIRVVVAAPPAARSVRLRLRVPQDEAIREIRIGGRRIRFGSATATVTIPHGRREARFRAILAA